MDVQDLIDEWRMNWRRKRSKHQLTLGELIKKLEAMPRDSMVVDIHSPHSYRGYYEDLAFERSNEQRPAHELLTECKEALNKTFTGYKGGEFVMDESTPLWIAPDGLSTGSKLMDVPDDDDIITQEERF